MKKLKRLNHWLHEDARIPTELESHNFAALGSYDIVCTELSPEEGGGYQAYHAELERSVVGYGKTQSAALGDLYNATLLFLKTLAEDNIRLTPKIVEGRNVY